VEREFSAWRKRLENTRSNDFRKCPRESSRTKQNLAYPSVRILMFQKWKLSAMPFLVQSCCFTCPSVSALHSTAERPWLLSCTEVEFERKRKRRRLYRERSVSPVVVEEPSTSPSFAPCSPPLLWKSSDHEDFKPTSSLDEDQGPKLRFLGLLGLQQVPLSFTTSKLFKRSSWQNRIMEKRLENTRNLQKHGRFVELFIALESYNSINYYYSYRPFYNVNKHVGYDMTSTMNQWRHLLSKRT